MSLHLWNRISSTRLSFLQPSWVKVKAGNLGSWVTIGRDRARKREEKCWVNRPEAWTNLWVLHCDWKNPLGLKTTGLASRMGQFSSLQLLSHVRLFATPWITARQASLSIINSQSLPKLTSIKSVMPSSHLIICCPPSPPAPNPSQHQGGMMSQLFAWGGQSIGCAGSASVPPMNTQDWSPLGWWATRED